MLTIGVFGVILDNENRLLLCHRRDFDLWNLPGGGLEKEESPWQGVIREVQEETGIIVKVQRLSGLYFKPKENEVVLVFLCEAIGGEIKLSDEADKIEYFKFGELPKNIPLKHVERAKDALGNTNMVAMKIQ